MTTFEWRYLPRGLVKHALRYADDHLTLCGIAPNLRSPDNWRGTGDQSEYEQIAVLRECRRCIERGGR